MNCAHCKKENREIARYCKWCGTPIVAHANPLDKLVGLAEVKEQMHHVVETFMHLKATDATRDIKLNINAIIIGETGTGKTAIPYALRDYLERQGILKKPKLKVVDAVDYERFVEHWDENIREVQGGILFFDNVQKLLPDSYSKNVNPLDKLFIEMDRWHNDPIVVLAGLPGGLEEFLEKNPVVKSRFRYLFRLPVLAAEEIYELCLRTLRESYAIQGLSPAASEKLMRQIKYEMKTRDDNAHHARAKAEDLFTAYISHPPRIPGEIQEEDITGYVPPVRTVDDILAELDAYTGMESVKQEIREMATYISMLIQRGERASATGRHYVFTGNPGTGKTTMARIMADIFKALDIVSRGQLVEADRSRLVAGYAGQTAIKTNQLVDSALGGVLFIDEAYTLVQGDNDTFGKEALDALLKRLEDDRGKFVCIVAGYTREMHAFIDANPGLKSRFTKTIHFEDYSPSELASIFMGMARKDKFVLSEETQKALLHHLERVHAMRDRNFGNAREVRKLFEQAVTNQSKRLAGLMNSSGFTQEMMYRLTTGDILGQEEKKPKTLDEVMAELDEFVGMNSIKEAIRRLAMQVIFMQQRLSLGIGKSEPMALNIILTGNPGTGKTSVARKMGEVFKAIGLLPTDKVVEADRNQLVGKYMGETPKLVNALCDQAMGGVLFIDEAYTLYDADGSGGDKYGKEAVEALMKRMEDDRGKLVVIAAGYRKEMEDFMQVNPGLESRFTHKLNIEDYTVYELVEIFRALAGKKQYILSESAEATLMERVHELYANKNRHFGNAREMRRLFDATVQQLSMRVAALPPEGLTQRDYQVIEPRDILGGISAG